MSGPARADATRQVATALAAIGQVVLPALLLPRFRRESAPPAVVQPASWTFAVWLPVYAAGLLHAADQARPVRRADPVLRAIGRPLTGAYSAVAVWAPLVASGRYRAAQGALVAAAAAAGSARRRAVGFEQEGRAAGSGAAFAAAAGLSAWGTAAAGVNLASMIAAYAPVRGRRARTGLGVATVAALSAASATAVHRAGARTRTTDAYGGVVLWALAGIVAGRRRDDPVTAAAAAVAAGPLVAALVRARRG